MSSRKRALDSYSDAEQPLSNVDQPNNLVLLYVKTGDNQEYGLPEEYLDALKQINVMQGGTASQTGSSGQPIEFVNGDKHLLRLNSEATCNRIVGALKFACVDFPLTTIQLNCSQILMN